MAPPIGTAISMGDFPPSAAKGQMMSDKDSILSVSELSKLLKYDPLTGQFTRLVTTSQNAKKGSEAGYISPIGYRVISIKSRQFYGHRLAWLYVHGEFPKGQIDHIDGNRANNAISNLRDVAEIVNRQNLRVPPKHNQLGILGVSRSTSGKRYHARIQLNGVKVHLGTYDTCEDAQAAYLSAKRSLHSGCTI